MRKKKYKFGESMYGPTMKKLYVEYLIPGLIAVDLEHIEFLKRMSEHLKADLAKDEKQKRLTGTEIAMRMEEAMKPIVYEAKGLIKLRGRKLMTVGSLHGQGLRHPYQGRDAPLCFWPRRRARAGRKDDSLAYSRRETWT